MCGYFGPGLCYCLKNSGRATTRAKAFLPGHLPWCSAATAVMTSELLLLCTVGVGLHIETDNTLTCTDDLNRLTNAHE